MRRYEELVAEAVAADVTGWGFGWLAGRASEQRPPWGYAGLLADRLSRAERALDVDTGGGEVVAEAPVLPADLTVTEGWPPNAAAARRRLGPRGVRVVEVAQGSPLPFADASFDLVTSRHPVAPDWPEIARVLRPGGRYFAQHVGPDSARELSEWFVGDWGDGPDRRDPQLELAAAREAGLRAIELRTFRGELRFHDIGAVVWTLRKCVWWVPDFDVERHEPQLRALDARLRAGHPFVAHSTRHLVELGR